MGKKTYSKGKKVVYESDKSSAESKPNKVKKSSEQSKKTS